MYVVLMSKAPNAVINYRPQSPFFKFLKKKKKTKTIKYPFINYKYVFKLQNNNNKRGKLPIYMGLLGKS